MNNFTFVLLLVTYGFILPINAYESITNKELTETSKALIKQLENEIVGTLLAIAENEKKAGNGMRNFHYHSFIPSDNHTEIGILVDAYSVSKGVMVVSVDAGSPAENAGISVGDIIIDINGIKISDVKNSSNIKYLWNFSPGQEINFGIISGNQHKEITLVASGVYLPQVSLNIGLENNINKINSNDNQCGIVSLRMAPNNLYDLSFKKIDGVNINSRQEFKRLSVGKHTLEFKIGSAVSNAVYHDRVTKMNITIEANTKYYLAAIPASSDEKRSDMNFKSITWKTENKNCN
jgi:hypothetical protein